MTWDQVCHLGQVPPTRTGPEVLHPNQTGVKLPLLQPLSHLCWLKEIHEMGAGEVMEMLARELPFRSSSEVLLKWPLVHYFHLGCVPVS